MTTRNRINLSEKQVAAIWQQVAGKELLSCEGESVTVVYPGRASDDNGPDFRDAVIVDGLRLTKGDVEVHVRSSDWYNHGHHTDADYNNVILHVAMWHDCDSATLLQRGRSIPLLCLAKALRHQPYLLPHRLPCFRAPDCMDRQNLAKLLNAAGEERFVQKATHFQTEILRPSPRKTSAEEVAGQVLFRGMMRALGYAKNTKPFENLADRMPLSSLESTKGLALKQALLLGTAGLLPSQRGQRGSVREEGVRELEQIWQTLGREVETMNESDWRFAHIYPNNAPVRRIIAQSYLLERYCEPRLLAAVLQLVRQAPLSKGHQVLENGLTVVGDSYWGDRFDFGARSKAKIPRIRYEALLGHNKAAEIAVNVILPFTFLWGKLANEAKLTENAIELYRSYPRLAENCLTRHMAKQLGLDDLFDLTACRQQGLIHIFHNQCRQGRCGHCPLVG